MMIGNTGGGTGNTSTSSSTFKVTVEDLGLELELFVKALEFIGFWIIKKL